MRNFYDYLFHGIQENLAILYENPANIKIIFSQNQAILEAIKSRDPDMSYTAMNAHIAFVRDFFKNNKI
ncbi:MAG: FCD domain-containing protein [Thermodesulfobacteriota bacterium]|nr:FCD domain-containing protein [Thermodesulfobacteriota bacterium]